MTVFYTGMKKVIKAKALEVEFSHLCLALPCVRMSRSQGIDSLSGPIKLTFPSKHSDKVSIIGSSDTTYRSLSLRPCDQGKQKDGIHALHDERIGSSAVVFSNLVGERDRERGRERERERERR